MVSYLVDLILFAALLFTSIRVTKMHRELVKLRAHQGEFTVVVGKTATLELKPEQAEMLARARQSGTLSLALRALVDVNVPETKPDDNANSSKRDSINVVRYGVPTTTTTQKTP